MFAFEQQQPFLSVHLGDLLTVVTIMVGILALRVDFNRRSDEQKKQRDDLLEKQAQMHTENRMKLDQLGNFHSAQLEVNAKRDIQISQLQQQTATLLEVAKGMDRRLQMMEDRTS